MYGKQNDDPSVWKFYKVGDIIKDSVDSIWEEKKFVIDGFHGNWYCPLASAFFLGKTKRISNMCNLDIRFIRLIDAPIRPFKKLPKKPLLKLMSKGNVEARREFTIRVNRKTL